MCLRFQWFLAQTRKGWLYSYTGLSLLDTKFRKPAHYVYDYHTFRSLNEIPSLSQQDYEYYFMLLVVREYRGLNGKNHAKNKAVSDWFVQDAKIVFLVRLQSCSWAPIGMPNYDVRFPLRAQAWLAGERQRAENLCTCNIKFKKNTREIEFLRLVYGNLRLPAYDWLDLETVDDI